MIDCAGLRPYGRLPATGLRGITRGDCQLLEEDLQRDCGALANEAGLDTKHLRRAPLTGHGPR
jgi:hypothetical protein